MPYLTVKITALILCLSAFALNIDVYGAKHSLVEIADSALVLYERGEFAESLALTENSSALDTTSPVSARIACIRGKNMSSLGMRQEAFQNLQKAVMLARRHADKSTEADALNSLFKIHHDTRNYAGGRDLLERALEVYYEQGDRHGQARILNNIALTYYADQDTEKAIELFNLAKSKTPEDTIYTAKISINIAETYYVTGNLKKSAEVLREVVHALHSDSPDETRLQALLNLALVEAQLRNFTRIRPLLADIRKDDMESREPATLPDAHRQLAHINFIIGDSIVGLRHILAAEELEDSMQLKENQQQLLQLLTFYNTEQLNERNNNLTLAVRNRTLIIYVTAIIFIAILIIAILLTARIRSDSRKNKLIQEQHEQLLEFERAENIRRENEYRREIDRKNRSLTSFAMDGDAVSELHNKVCANICSVLENVTDSDKRKLSESITALQNYNRVKVSEDFKTHFNEVHPEFHNRLRKHHPHLTDHDLRLCSYLYLGLSTKQIAGLTYREVRSVESSRLRLRKKLNIPADQSLFDYLHSIYD